MQQATVSVGIAAYNAERNIKKLLWALLEQQGDFLLEKIIVHSDRSSDKTVEKAREVNNRHIIVIDRSERVGFAHSLQTLLEKSESDVTVLLNDDIEIYDKDFLTKLLKNFQTSPKVGLISGNSRPYVGKNFVQQMTNSAFRVYEKIKLKLKQGGSIYTCDGKVLAFSKSFKKGIVFPKNYKLMGNVDSFLYLSCLRLGFDYLYSSEAVVYYTNPGNLADYISWTLRNSADPNILKVTFGDIALQEFSVPLALQSQAFFSEFISHPLYCFALFFLTIYIRLKLALRGITWTQTWNTVESTKTFGGNDERSLTVGIPAYNEEKNIIRLLESILAQTRINYQLEKILVVSDGSSDRTEDLVKEFRIAHPEVELLADGKRLGKATRLNYIYNINLSDLLLTLDADVYFKDPQTIDSMVAGFLKKPEVSVLSARIDVLKPSRGIIPYVLYANQKIWNDITGNYNNGNNINTLHGPASLMDKDFAKSFVFPRSITCDEAYLYIMAQQKRGYRFLNNVSVCVKAITSAKEMDRGNARFLNERQQLVPIFGKEILKLFHIPLRSKIYGTFKVAWRNPFSMLVFLGYNLYLKAMPPKTVLPTSQPGIWEPLQSTKENQ